MKRRVADPQCGHVRSLARSVAQRRATLRAAEGRCLCAGERWTKPRQRTYELLVEAEGPARAYDLIAAFAPGGVKPPTVYRALDFLLAHGLAHRVESLNAFIACTHVGQSHAAEFLICDCCGRAEELAMAALGPISASGLPSGFEIRTVTLEMRGLCPACQTARA